MQKLTSLILQIAMVMGAIYYRVKDVRADLSGAQEQTDANVTRALELLKQARTAMGGEEALKSVQSLSISATARRTFQDENGQTQERSGKLRLYFVTSGKLIEKAGVKLDTPPEAAAAQDDRVVIIRRAPAPGTPGAGDQAFGAEGQPGKMVMRFKGPPPPMPPPPPMVPVHFLMTSILGAGAPSPIEYSYAGEAQTEAGSADIVEAKYPGGLIVRFMLDKQTHLPVGMTYRALMPPLPGQAIMFRNRIGKEVPGKGDVMPAPGANHGEIPDVLFEPSEIEEEGITIERNPSQETFQIPLPPPQEREAQVSFSDFRVVNGILLPYRITQTLDDKATETWEVEKYEINSSAPKLEKLEK